MFELRLNNKTIPLKWGTWAMREFCITRGTFNEKNELIPLSINKYFELFTNTNFDIDTIIKLIYIGYKSNCISNKINIEYDEVDVCNWLDEIGSIFNVEGQVIEYMKYIMETTVINIRGNQKEEEKKKPNRTKLG